MVSTSRNVTTTGKPECCSIFDLKVTLSQAAIGRDKAELSGPRAAPLQEHASMINAGDGLPSGRSLDLRGSVALRKTGEQAPISVPARRSRCGPGCRRASESFRWALIFC